MTARRVLTLFAPALVCVLLGATTAHAQSAGDEPPPGQRGHVPAYLLKNPGSRDVTVPTEAERSQEDVRRAQERARRSREEPAPRAGYGQPGYIGPLSTETSTGRMGASGWASPAIDPLGSASTPEQKAGQFGFGFSTEWGVQRPRGSTEAP